MEVTLIREEKVSVDRLRAECEVRYWEDATVNGVEDTDGYLIPLRSGDFWTPTIMLNTGRILDWPEGTTAKIHYKVCDAGAYALLSPAGEKVAEIEGYVPGIMSPGGDGYGDYVIMEVGADGIILDCEPDLEPWSAQ